MHSSTFRISFLFLCISGFSSDLMVCRSYFLFASPDETGVLLVMLYLVIVQISEVASKGSKYPNMFIYLLSCTIIQSSVPTHFGISISSHFWLSLTAFCLYFEFTVSGMTNSNYTELNQLYEKYKDQGMFFWCGLCKFYSVILLE